MTYIVTKPPFSRTEIEDAINRIASVKTKKIDGVVLSNLVRLCHECGLKKSELIDLSAGDVAKGGVVGDVMRIGEDEIILSDPAKQLLQNHIDYLKKSGYRLYPTYPLFPTRKKTRYAEKTLGNHLKAAQTVEIESQSA
jgi:site-specific recombinase XerD